MSQPIKVLMVTHNYPRFDGDYAGIFLSLLFRKLVNYGIEPIVLVPHDAGCKEFEIIDGVKIYRFRYGTDEEENIAYRGNMHQLVLGSVDGIFKFKSFLNAYRKAALNVAQEEQVNLLAGHWLIPSGLILKPLAKKTGLPVVMSSHGTDIRLMRKYFNLIYRYFKHFSRSFKSWTVVSNFLKNGILELDKTLDPILNILPMPHDEELFFIDDAISRDKNLTVAVTRFTEQKRVDYLIKAFALIAGENKSARLHIYATGGSMEPEIKELIKKFGLGDNVTIFQPVAQADLRVIYNKAAVVVLNSFEEGFGLALSEAMLCGAAVVGVNSGGITDIIKNNQTGLLVELDNSSQLADAISRLLDNSELRTKLAHQGNQFAKENYLSDKSAGRYADLLKQAVNQ